MCNDPGMDTPAPAASRKGVRAAAAIAAVAGVVALISAFLPWAGIDEATYQGGALFGEQVPSVPELEELVGTGSIPGLSDLATKDLPSAAGRSDWAGLLVGLASIGLIASAFFMGGRGRGLAAVLAMAMGGLVVVLGLTALFRSESMAVNALRGSLKADINELLGGIPFIGGLLDRVVDEVTKLFSFETSPGLGVYLAIAAGLVAVVGGWLGLPQETAVVPIEPGPEAPPAAPAEGA